MQKTIEEINQAAGKIAADYRDQMVALGDTVRDRYLLPFCNAQGVAFRATADSWWLVDLETGRPLELTQASEAFVVYSNKDRRVPMARLLYDTLMLSVIGPHKLFVYVGDCTPNRRPCDDCEGTGSAVDTSPSRLCAHCGGSGSVPRE